MNIRLLDAFGPTLSALLAISLIKFFCAQSYTRLPLSFALVKSLLFLVSDLLNASALS
jgi:hypothetical protein